MYLKEIADSLFNKHAAVMIGAGFSKNAKKSSTSIDNKFSDWTELADKFYEKLYGSSNSEKVKYYSPLALAQEVEIAYGRPTLENILKESIPDMDYVPSVVYENLLNLPWKDIFTTNYDTLLERASETVVKKRFNIVTCKEDLVNSADTVRIVKLHGSFPSHRPFIITEEDYRKYPYNFAPFVNTVQQSFIENIFCMIGFSCDDPNFLNWIGWIHDNLGKENSHKIYMISVDGELEAKIKKLLDKNIIVINLAYMWPDLDIEHRINMAFSYMQNIIDDKAKVENWPNTTITSWDVTIEECIEKMREMRKKYPGWIVLPWDNKRKVSLSLDIINRKLYPLMSEPENRYAIDFLYEYVLFKDLCNQPIWRNSSSIIHQILKRSIEKHNETTDLNEKTQIILLHLLRSYRENGMTKEWDDVNKKIDEETLTYDGRHFFDYEKCMHALFNLDAMELKEKIMQWEIDDGDVYWNLKKCSLLVELGEHQQVRDTLMKALNTTRKRIVQDKLIKNLRVYSLESCLVALINHVTQASEEYGKLIEKNNSNPFNWYHENQHYSLLLTPVYYQKTNFETKQGFDLDHISHSISFSNSDGEAITAFEFLRFREETGHPFRVCNIVNYDGVEGTIKRIVNYNPTWAFITAIRSNKIKCIDDIYNRSFISDFSMEEIDEVCEKYLEISVQLMCEVNPKNWINPSSIFEYSAELLPEVISRLCNKCSIEMLDRVLEVTLTIYKSEKKYSFKNMRHLIKRLIKSYTVNEQLERIQVFFEFPIISSNEPIEYPDPISFFNFNYIENKIIIEEQEYNEIINKVLNNTESDEIQEGLFLRLYYLYFIIQLNESEINYLKDNIWKNHMEIGIPDYPIAELMLLPIPDSINLNERLKISGMSNLRNVMDENASRSSIQIYKDLLCLVEKKIIGIEELIEILDISMENFNNVYRRSLEMDIFGSKARVSENLRISALIMVIIIINNLGSVNEIQINKLSKYIECLDEDNVENACLKIMYTLLSNKNGTANLFLPYAMSEKEEDVSDVMFIIKHLFEQKDTAILENSDFEKILEIIAQRILRSSIYCEIGIIQSLTDIIECLGFERIPKVIAIVLHALELALKETHVLNSDTIEIVTKKYEKRKAMANLGYKLYQLYLKDEDECMPDILKNWEEACKSNNEISEIRNQWQPKI
jgi:hypothetical protein